MADDNDYPLSGETLGLWRLVSGLGRGGMGEVYEAVYDFLHLLTLRHTPEERGVIRRELARLPRAEQSRLASEMLGTPLPADARFAIKVCSARSGTAGHRRFLQEAELAQRLGDHPYIVTVHAIHSGAGGETSLTSRDVRQLQLPVERGRHSDVAFMVMDLAARDYDHTRLTKAEAIHVVRCIALALDHAHQAGVVHRDLKPENILGSRHHPLLTDFGIAKELDQSLGLTRTGQIIGTLDYMSPEQATDAKNVDHRSDIYSLGVVLYEFATGGHLPYIHLAEREAALGAIRSERAEPRWPRDHVAKFPTGLERIILKATAHRQTDRYQTMSDLVRDLDKVTRGDRIWPFGRVAPRRYTRHWLQRHPRAAWAIVSGIVVVCLAWLVLLVQVWSDTTRRRLDAGLVEFQRAVERIEQQHEGMLSHADRVAYLTELGRLVDTNSEAYRDRARKYYALVDRLDRARTLKVQFHGGGGEQLAHDIAAKDRLTLAADVIDPSWELRAGGLVVLEDLRLELGPYGSGTMSVYLKATLANPDGFRLELSEYPEADGATPKFSTILAMAGGQLSVNYRADERPIEELGRRRPVPSGSTIELYADLQPDRVRAWLWPDALCDAQEAGLRDTAKGRVVMHLPRGTVLHGFEIWLQAWD